jgi:hypothetical protein
MIHNLSKGIFKNAQRSPCYAQDGPLTYKVLELLVNMCFLIARLKNGLPGTVEYKSLKQGHQSVLNYILYKYEYIANRIRYTCSCLNLICKY